MTIGEKIKSIRKEKGLSQQELADLMQVNVQTIRSYESDKYKPGIDRLGRLADALGEPAIYFTGSVSLEDARRVHFDTQKGFLIRSMLFNIYDGAEDVLTGDFDYESYTRININGIDYAITDERKRRLYVAVEAVIKAMVEYDLVSEEDYLNRYGLTVDDLAPEARPVKE